MTNHLYDNSDAVITDKLVTATHRLDTIKVINRLLDGSHHIQVIGNGAPVLDCQVVCETEESKEMLDSAHATGEPVKAATRGKWWKGPIISEGLLDWSWKAGIWETSFQISVDEEGSL